MNFAQLQNQGTQRRGFTFIELLVVFLVIVLLVALMLPAIGRVREAARRIQCKNNLYQLSIGVQNYQMAFGVLPPGCVNSQGPVVHEDVGYHMGWLAQLTPMIEQSVVHQATDYTRSVYDPINVSSVGKIVIPTLLCPSADVEPGSTSYVGCTGGADVPLDENNNGLLFLNSSISQNQIKDGTSNTILLSERVPRDTPNGMELGWMTGTSASLRHTGLPPNKWPRPSNSTVPVDLQVGAFNSPHDNNTIEVALADGSVTTISDSIAITVWQNYGNRNDGVHDDF